MKELTIKDFRGNFTWEEIHEAMKELLHKMETMGPDEDATEEEREAFEDSNPVVIGYGDTVLVLPTYAQTYNFLDYGIRDFLSEGY